MDNNCVYKTADDHQKTVLDILVMALDQVHVLEQAHVLEQTTCQQSLCAQWHESRKGKVTASRLVKCFSESHHPVVVL